MKRSCLVSHASAIECAFAAAILAGFLFTSVPALADISVRIDIGNAPPAPRIVFLAQPHEVRYPGSPVYVVNDPRVGDNDCFHYSGYYWVFRDGYWYRSASWRGPFVVFDPRNVPAVFYQQSPTRWKHHPSGPPVFANQSGGGPPGLAKKSAGGPPGQVKKKASRGNDKGGGHGGK